MRRTLLAYACASWANDVTFMLLLMLPPRESIGLTQLILVVLAPVFMPIRYALFLGDRLFGPVRDSPSNMEIYLPLVVFLLVFVSLISPAYSNYRRRKHKKLGLCVNCGYDLRGSNERCPECGREFETT